MAQQVVDRVVAGERRRMSYEEWLAWDAEGVKSEWVEGEAIVFMTTIARHWDPLHFLATLLSAYARLLGLGRVLGNGFEMRIGGRSRLPDLLFVRTDQLHRMSERRLDGAADLVIELVSADSVERDRAEKFAEYAWAGVREYWAIEARLGAFGAEFYELADGAYLPIPLDAEGRAWSRVVEGFWLRPDWLFQNPLPNAWPLVALIAPEAARAALETPASGGPDSNRA